MKALSDSPRSLRPYFAEKIGEKYAFARTAFELVKKDEGKRFDPKVVRTLEYLLKPAPYLPQ